MEHTCQSSMLLQVLLMVTLSLGTMEGNELLRCRECRFTTNKALMTSPKCLECMCDNACFIYGDCCIDILLSFGYNKPPLSQYSCVAQKEGRHMFGNLDPAYGYFMVTSYADNEGLKKPCDSEVVRPVTSTLSNKTFINFDCAIYNKEYSVIPWSSDEHCTNQKCITVFPPPKSAELRTCDGMRSRLVISECNSSNVPSVTDLEIENCHKYYLPVYAGDYVFQNLYCYMCARLPISLVKNIDVHHPIKALTRFGGEFAPKDSVLKCDGSKEWMDTPAKRCREVMCYGNVHPTNGECDVAKNIVQGFNFSSSLTLKIKNSEYSENVHRQIITNAFTQFLEGSHSRNYIIGISEPFLIENGSYSKYYVKCWFTVTGNVTLYVVKDNVTSLANYSFIYGRIYSKTTLMHLNAQPEDVRYTSFYKPDRENGLCCNEMSYKSENLDMLYTPITNQLLCAYIYFDVWEYQHRFPIVHIPHLNITLQKEMYYINSEKKLVVCLLNIQNILNASYINETLVSSLNTKLSLNDYISWYITIFCVAMSLICLFISMLTYIVNPENRTLARSTNMGLVVSLFLAQLSLLCGIGLTGDIVICQGVGMIIHCLWLSVIFWMNVCSYHMFKVFVRRSLVRPSSDGHAKNMVKYTAYATGVPVLIVAGTVVGNTVVSNGSESGYGGNICYLSSSLLVGVSFVIPLVLIILCNVTFFLLTVLSIHKVKESKAQTGRERKYISIYLKLSMVTGLFWLVAILSEVLNNSVLEYISILLNGSQGVFLFFAFSWNRNVIKLWKFPTSRMKSRSSDLTSNVIFTPNTVAH